MLEAGSDEGEEELYSLFKQTRSVFKGFNGFELEKDPRKLLLAYWNTDGLGATSFDSGAVWLLGLWIWIREMVTAATEVVQIVTGGGRNPMKETNECTRVVTLFLKEVFGPDWKPKDVQNPGLIELCADEWRQCFNVVMMHC